MDPNADQIVWTEGPDRPDSVGAPWWPVAGSRASLRAALQRDWRTAVRQRITAVAASLRRPPRRGRRSAVAAVTMSIYAALLLLVPSGLFPVWLKLTGAVALVTSSWAEVLPDRLEAAIPAMRVVAHVFLVSFFVGLLVVFITA